MRRDGNAQIPRSLYKSILTLKASAKWSEQSFHGGNTGSKPVGDANQIRHLQKFLIPPRYGFEYGSPGAALHCAPLAFHLRRPHRRYSL